MIIRLEKLSFHYPRGKNIFDGFSLDISERDRLCFRSPSGGGKTTLLRLILGLERPHDGSVTVRDGVRFAAVFQEDRLIPWKTVRENTALFSSTVEAERVLGCLGLADVMDVLPGELSGGMKRRAALARALCSPFDVLVLDEAFNGLDEAAKHQCMCAVNDRCSDKTLLMASHNSREAAFLRCSECFI